MKRIQPLPFKTPALFAATLIGLAAPALASDTPTTANDAFPHDFQERVGGLSNFYVEGPATLVDGQTHDSQGDAFIRTVVMPNGETFTHFYTPIAVHDLSVGVGDADEVRIIGGNRISDGMQGMLRVGDAVGDGSNNNHATLADYEAFKPQLLDAMGSPNLNLYLDNSGRNPEFEFTLEFAIPLKDNDPEPDDFGELLYFERGADSGNSWITIQAVDENGVALGPALAVCPFETVQTTPQTKLSRWGNQFVGSVSVDISRLGVSETRFLKVRKTRTSDDGYYRAGAMHEDFNPDFKFMAVITNEEQLEEILEPVPSVAVTTIDTAYD
ncbi:MAG: hypothetical protein AAGH92_12150 [Planctomycetota bacterium]